MKLTLRISVIIMTVIIVLLAISLVTAKAGFDDEGNPNDPRVNPRANACYEGGSLEGQCDTLVMWRIGWYLMRFQAGIISADEFPAEFAWIISDTPAATQDPSSAKPPAPPIPPR